MFCGSKKKQQEQKKTPKNKTNAGEGVTKVKHAKKVFRAN